jgi:hypothetical protein
MPCLHATEMHPVHTRVGPDESCQSGAAACQHGHCNPLYRLTLVHTIKGLDVEPVERVRPVAAAAAVVLVVAPLPPAAARGRLNDRLTASARFPAMCAACKSPLGSTHRPDVEGNSCGNCFESNSSPPRAASSYKPATPAAWLLGGVVASIPSWHVNVARGGAGVC